MACCLGFSTGAAQQTVHTTLGITWPLDFRTNAYRQSAIGFFAKVDRNFTENVQLGVKVQTEGHTARVGEMAGYIYGAELLKSLDLSPTDVVEIYVPARSFVAALTGAYVWNRNERWAPHLGAAVGVSHDSPGGSLFAASGAWHGSFEPEVGITYRKHWDVSLAYRFTQSTYSHATLSVGYRF